jgi:lincosamide nucleotidyltransferase A/C/D/E
LIHRKVKPQEARPWNFALGDSYGREVDVHAIVLDRNGNGQYGPPENNEMYPAASLTGSGVINGLSVRCISPEWMVKFHSATNSRRETFGDVSALCQKFGIDLPEAFAKFRKPTASLDTLERRAARPLERQASEP